MYNPHNLSWWMRRHNAFISEILIGIDEILLDYAIIDIAFKSKYIVLVRLV